MEVWKQETSRLLGIFFPVLIVTAAANESAPFGAFLVKEWVLVTKMEAHCRSHIVVAALEPNSLLIPHYMDADLIIFLQTGEAEIDWICKLEGVLHFQAGSSFYLVNVLTLSTFSMLVMGYTIRGRVAHLNQLRRFDHIDHR